MASVGYKYIYIYIYVCMYIHMYVHTQEKQIAIHRNSHEESCELKIYTCVKIVQANWSASANNPNSYNNLV